MLAHSFVLNVRSSSLGRSVIVYRLNTVLAFTSQNTVFEFTFKNTVFSNTVFLLIILYNQHVKF